MFYSILSNPLMNSNGSVIKDTKPGDDKISRNHFLSFAILFESAYIEIITFERWFSTSTFWMACPILMEKHSIISYLMFLNAPHTKTVICELHLLNILLCL